MDYLLSMRIHFVKKVKVKYLLLKNLRLKNNVTHFQCQLLMPYFHILSNICLDITEKIVQIVHGAFCSQYSQQAYNRR